MRDDQEFIERRILTGMIVSKAFIDRIHKFWNSSFLESPEIRKIAKWCLEHYRKYGDAPDENIQAIYMAELSANHLSKAEASYIEEVLSGLSDEYGRGTQFNVAYLFDQTIKFCKKQELKRHNDEIQDLIDSGEVEKAEQLAKSFSPLIVDEEDRGLDLSSQEALDRIDHAFNEAIQSVVKYPGALGVMWNEHLVRGGFFSLLSPEKRGKCLPGNQRILLSDGAYMPLADVIKNGRKDIITFNEDSRQFEVGVVNAYWDNGAKPVYKVTTKTGRTVTTTKNHPFLTPDGWRELGGLVLGDFIAVPKITPVFGEADLPEYIVRLLAYFITEGYTKTYAGFTTADRNIKWNFNHCVAQADCATVWRGIDARVINSDENRGKHNKNYVLQMLKQYGLWGKLCYDKTIPDIIFQLPKHKLALFLRVLFTCDGWVNKWKNNQDNQIGFSVSNKILAEQVHVLLTRFGIVSKLSFKKNDKKGAWSVSISDAENMKLFCEEIGFLYQKQQKAQLIISQLLDNHKSFLDKFPYQIAQSFHNEVLFELDGVDAIDPEKKRWQNIPNFRRVFSKAPSVREQIVKKRPLMRRSFQEVKNTKAGIKYLDSCILWDEIVSIEYQGEQPTFDLTINKHHNFIAENIIVHNTHWLLEISMRAIRQKSNVAFFQAGDMTESQLLRRICVYIAQKSDKEKYCQERFRPVGDCLLNQLDICTRPDRNCDHGVFEGIDMTSFIQGRTNYVTREVLKTKYEEFPEYEPCDSNNCQERKSTVWVKRIPKTNPLTAKQAKKHLTKFFGKYQRHFKVITVPAGTLTVSDIKTYLNNWERYDGFVPDLIAIDYADLLSADDGKVSDFRHRQDHIWKGLRGLSQEKHALVLTATQADADSYKKGRLSISNFSEDKRKLAHVTAQYGLNQDPSGREKELGILRINEIVVREGEFSPNNEVTVLQDLSIARSFLESFV